MHPEYKAAYTLATLFLTLFTFDIRTHIKGCIYFLLYKYRNVEFL